MSPSICAGCSTRGGGPPRPGARGSGSGGSTMAGPPAGPPGNPPPIIGGGSAAPPAPIRWFRERGVRVNHLWGMTEMSPIGTVGAPCADWDSLTEDEQLAYMSRPGRSMFGVELRVVDDAGNVLPRDGTSSGKLQTRGPSVVRRYFKHDKDCVDADQWFETGH